jgi:hypothetical protein
MYDGVECNSLYWRSPERTKETVKIRNSDFLWVSLFWALQLYPTFSVIKEVNWCLFVTAKST